jgi:hypothetical protein
MTALRGIGNIPNTTSDAKANFDISGAAPGTYWLLAVLGGQSFGGPLYGGFAGPGLRLGDGTNALMPVEVGTNPVENLTVTLRPSRSIPIHASVDAGTINLSQVSVSFVRTPDLLGMPTAQTGRLTPDGTFTLTGVGPGDYRIEVAGLPQDAYVKSMKLGPTDVLESGLHVTNETEGPLEISLAANGGTVSGSVINARRELVANATVVLVPDFPRREQASLYKVVFSDPTGRFSINGVTPGGYRIFSWESVADGAWQDSRFLQVYETRGSAVRVSEGGGLNVDVVSIPDGTPQ